jgi:acetyl-CoA acetyltransferase
VSDARQPVIAGSFEGPSGKTGQGAFDLFAQGATGAMRDAGVAAGEVDALLTSFSWEDPRLMPSDFLAEYLGATPAYTETVCLGGASPAGMVGRAAQAIRDGVCDVAVLSSASNRASGMGKEAAIDALREVAHPKYEAPFGAFVPALYALVAQRHAHEFGTTEEDLAAVAVLQRGHAERNPAAFLRDPLTVDQAVGSKLISAPLRVTDCCLLTDFCAGLVMMTRERAEAGGCAFVPVLGYGEARSFTNIGQASELTTQGAAASGTAAFAQAGVGPADMDFAQLYDCFTITVLITLEDLGFCEKGDSARLIGTLPLNTNGGMLSFSTGGMYHVTEAVSQLRGRAGERQVDGARLGVVNGVGGVFSANCTLVLGAAT